MGRRLLLLFLLLALPVNVYGTETDVKQVWNDIAADVLEFGKQENFEQAKTMLEQFSDVFPGDQGNELTSTELRIILNAQERALRAVTSVDKAADQRIQALTEFRLAVDALVAEKQPMWRQTDSKLLPLIKEMAAAIKHGDSDVYETSKQRFIGTYSIIRPAMAIDLSTETQARLDSHIAFIEQYASSDDKKLVGQLETMHDDFEKAYHSTRNEDETSLLWLISSIGGMITVTLLYVIYRKYRGEKEEKKRKQVE
ncbi:sporulation protein YpjB [Pseudalkalibacillus hwajinpoensis]|uniref:sporulation protein YpjB n=1 Tax=Guptibacillus hwajinpoensis TaxID=208199 RepID=UPI00325BD989